MSAQVIYVKMPRTAGTSLRQILRKTIFPHSEIYVETKKWPKKKELKQAKLLILGEIIAKKFKCKYPDIWQGARSFAIVRNPYEKTVSAWKHCKSTKNKALSRVLSSAMPRNKFWTRDNHDYIHFTVSQSQYLVSQGEIIVDKIFKFEDIINSPKALFEYLNLPITTLPHENRAKNKNPNGLAHLPTETLDLIFKKFSEDFQNFTYPKGIHRL